MQTARLALVVVTRERASVFERFLLPSLRHVPPSDVDVVVVDQSAGSETRELLRELPWVRYLRSEPGLSRGRNVGVAATDAEITVFTDDDVEFDPDWLSRQIILVALSSAVSGPVLAGPEEFDRLDEELRLMLTRYLTP